MTGFDYGAALADMRKAFRKMRLWIPSRDKVDVPKWALAGDRLGKLAKRQTLLLKKGEVVWGALVQANNQMFVPGNNNCPGNMIYSRDPAMDAQPAVLGRAAHELFLIKGKAAASPEMQRFSDTLADELERLMYVPVPRELTEGIDCVFTGLMFERRHLPGRIIDRQILPMLVHADFEDTMVLPQHYWPRAFTQLARW